MVPTHYIDWLQDQSFYLISQAVACGKYNSQINVSCYAESYKAFSCGAQSSNSTLVIFAEMLIGLDRSLKANSKELCTRETQM